MLLLLYSVLKLLIFLYNSLLDFKYIQLAPAIGGPSIRGFAYSRIEKY